MATAEGAPARVALVTRASKGIGQDIAERFARDGMHVCVHYASDQAGAEETARRVEGDRSPRAHRACRRGEVGRCRKNVRRGRVALRPRRRGREQWREAQTHQVYKNVAALLEEAGGSLDNLVMTTTYSRGSEVQGRLQQGARRLLQENPPTSTRLPDRDRGDRDALIFELAGNEKTIALSIRDRRTFNRLRPAWSQRER